ncbi:hypothetical protein Moror_17552 [Moniliophthora roreri MCA 2997]|uniref:Uncharacterized protein n=1 Tax=Moniliophthora roreri (strain MCA 2997) TaxID=1381753 RepID=V2XUU5_MONRO|nr:hypothetical protein Moror_17552 [Moniliophthora roreri MCA 2997]KAI3612364.1 hypothetical protein WG66_009905 [Moniliophthora roreri]
MTLPIDTEELQFTVPDGWNLCVHPRGWIYFHNPFLKLLTDQDIRNPEKYNQLQVHASDIDSSEWEEGMEIILQVNRRGDVDFLLAINHSNCVAARTPEAVTDKAVKMLDAHDLNRCRRLYWNYLWSHPTHVPCPSRAIPDAADALTWYYTDNLLSGPRCNAPFSKQECDELMKLVQEMELPCNAHSPAKTVFLAWLLREVCSYRNSQDYGRFTRGESLDHTGSQRIYDPSLHDRKPSTIFLPILHIISNVLFFGIPWTYLAHVRASFEYHGRFVALQARWAKYIERLVREYSHFLLVSTVLLSATVGMLAVPEISAVSRIAATISAFLSLGSVIVGVFSMWRHQANMQPTDAFTYMRNAHQHVLGLHGLAMLLSIPPVLLIWAVITFAVSVVSYTTQGIDEGDVLARSLTWITLGIFFVILGTVMTALHSTFSLVWHIPLGSTLWSLLVTSWKRPVRSVGRWRVTRKSEV